MIKKAVACIVRGLAHLARSFGRSEVGLALRLCYIDGELRGVYGPGHPAHQLKSGGAIN